MNHYILIFTFFLIDVFSAIIFKYYLLKSLAVFIFTLSFDKIDKFKFGLIIFLLSIQSFLEFGIFGLNIIPTLLTIYAIDRSRIFFAKKELPAITYLIIFLLCELLFTNSRASNSHLTAKILVICLLLNITLISVFLQVFTKKNFKKV